MIVLYFIALALAGLACMIGFFVIGKKNKLMSSKRTIMFYLLFALLISAGGFIGYSPVYSGSMAVFVLLQAVYLGIGFLAAFLYRQAAKLASDEGAGATYETGGASWGGVLFVAANTIVGMVGFGLLYHFFNPSGLAPYFALCVVPIMLPEALRGTFRAYAAIPQDIHQIWYYPVHADEVDFRNVDTEKMLMLELEFSKTINDPRLTNTKLRAPIGMRFGDWFRSYVEHHNDKFDNDRIQYLDYDGTPQGWMFYVKPGLLGAPRYVDPEKTIQENRLTEKNTIIARRVGLIADEEEDN